MKTKIKIKDIIKDKSFWIGLLYLFKQIKQIKQINIDTIIGFSFAIILPIITISPIYSDFNKCMFVSTFTWFMFISWILSLTYNSKNDNN